MWYLSYFFFLVFPPLGLTVNTLWTKLRCQLKDGWCAVIHIHGEGGNSYLLEAVSAILRKVIQSGDADLVIEREEKTVGNWSWQANVFLARHRHGRKQGGEMNFRPGRAGCLWAEA